MAKDHSGDAVGLKRAPSAMTPLWVLSLFISSSEAVTTIAATQVDGGVQVALTAFAVAFPVIVFSAFIAILWKKPYVFYPPTEFGSGTTVQEYVHALGGGTPVQHGNAPDELLGRVSVRSARAAEDTPAEQSARAELASSVLDYFSFRGMQYSNVATADAQAIYNLGALHGFNLFDGASSIVFFGYFPESEETVGVARTKFLLERIKTAYDKANACADGVQRAAAVAILDRISIEVMIPEDADAAAAERMIARGRPRSIVTPVRVLRPCDIRAAVRAELDAMRTDPPNENLHLTGSARR